LPNGEALMSYRSTNFGGTYYRPSFFGGFSFFPPVIKWLLVSNTVIWLLVDFFFVPFKLGGIPLGGERGVLTELFALWPLGTNFWPWQLVTYMFLHGGFGHLFFNMLALWMFGMELENLWGSKRFLTFYLVCGLGAGIANLLVAPLLSQGAPTVGASGAVFGVLVAFGMLFPDRPIYIYFLLPIRAKFFVAGYILLELFYGVTGTSSGIAHFAHLGGAAVGFAYVALMARGFDLNDVWTRIRGGPRVVYDQRRTRKPLHEEVYDAKFFDITTGHRMDAEDELNQEVVDAILDKINTSGYQSLTEEEKRILNDASKKIN
jgi:membrane associated rhomboid family serine protease